MSKKDSNEHDISGFKRLKYLPTYLLIFIIRFIGRRQHNTLLTLGRVLGLMAYYLVRRRRKIAAINIRLCFPELNAQEQKELVRQTMIDNAIGMMEIARAWAGNLDDLPDRLTIEGAEYLLEALDRGQGVLMIGAHYTSLDFGAAMSNQVAPITVGYAPHKNPVFDKFIREGRKSFIDDAIDRNDMRGIVRVLKEGRILWYAPDQDYGKNHSVFAPFFGVQAATVKLTPKLATFNNSAVLVTSYHRDADNQRYIARFHPILEDYPSGDDVADATRINQLLETEIRRSPSQYMWVHRRFKTTPEGEEYRYSEL